jgi:hypothetical protein
LFHVIPINHPFSTNRSKTIMRHLRQLSPLLFFALTSVVFAQAVPNARARQAAQDQAAVERLEWHDVTTWGVEGRILPDQERLRWFDRLPASAEKTVTPAVWNLSRDSAGMMVRFKTNATEIGAH